MRMVLAYHVHRVHTLIILQGHVLPVEIIVKHVTRMLMFVNTVTMDTQCSITFVINAPFLVYNVLLIISVQNVHFTVIIQH